MGIKYAKVDRNTGRVCETKVFEEIKRDLSCPNKECVWLEVVNESRPQLDTVSVPDPRGETGTSEIAIQKAVKTTTIPDISDLQIPVPPDTKVTYGFRVVDMTEEEIQIMKDSFIRGHLDNDDKELTRLVEQILVKIATKSSRLTKDDFSQETWDYINTRWGYRGEDEV